MTIHDIIAAAQARLNAHARQVRAVPPEFIADASGGLSMSVRKYCNQYNLSLDWLVLDLGPQGRVLR